MDTERDARRSGTGGLTRTLAVGAGAIALFAIGGLAVIWAMGDGSAPAPAAFQAPPAAEPVRPAGIAAAPLSPARPAPAVASPSGPQATPSPEELDPSWREVPLVFRTRDGLGVVGGYVFAGLRAAQEDMKHCYVGGAAAKEAEGATGPPPLLVLYLDSRAGVIDVVDVRVEDPGTASPEFVECCRAVLRGSEFKVPNARPGQRYRLKYSL